MSIPCMIRVPKDCYELQKLQTWFPVIKKQTENMKAKIIWAALLKLEMNQNSHLFSALISTILT